MVQVLESRFLSSASSIDNAPSPSTTEIVCLGRSNVGKSTFINALLNKPLAKSSATPGKTPLINFFYSLCAMRNERIPLTLIDLPGFGYAKVSKSLKNEWQKHLLPFLSNRPSIKLFLHLVDSRHTDMEADIMMNEVLKSICRGDSRIMRIYTKADKLTQSALNTLKSKIENLSHNETDSQQIYHFLFSATAKNHRKMTSIANMRESIITHTLGYSNGV